MGFVDGGPRLRLTDDAPDADPVCASPARLRLQATLAGEPLECPLVAHALALELVGAGLVAPVGALPSETTVSWFHGQPDEWQTGIAAYRQVAYPEAWPGIDAVYERAPGVAGLKSTYLVAPGADPAAIHLAWHGAEAATVDEAGALVLTTPVGTVREAAPVAWQDRPDGGQDPVAARFSLLADGTDGNPIEVGLAVGRFDRTRALTIDPVIVYAGYIGGAQEDLAYAIAVDSSGAAYVVGNTNSNATTDGFPAAGGPSTTNSGGSDAFVAKVRPDGLGLTYAGYIGGTQQDYGRGVAVDSAGAAYVVGYTGSFATANGFPATVGPNTVYGGNLDAFVAKVRPNGTGLDYAGYIGGTQTDAAFGVAVDSSGAAYVVGQAGSNATGQGFPATVGPNTTYGGNVDAFVAKVRPNGTGLDYAGYIGGTQSDAAFGVAVDSSGAAYVAGFTQSNATAVSMGGHGFPASVGPNTTLGGDYDGFVAKVQPSGDGLAYAGYVGGTQFDEAVGVAVDSSGAAYVAGLTNSNATAVSMGGHGFPASVGPNTVFSGNGDGFVAKVQPNGLGLVYVGYIGGSHYDEALGIAVDASGAAYVVGDTTSNSTTQHFPASGGPSSNVRWRL